MTALPPSIRPCSDADLGAVFEVINTAATAYAGVIPADRYHVPYMPADELRGEIAAGVRFWGWYDAEGPERAEAFGRTEAGGGTQELYGVMGIRELCGVMGVQDVDDVTLIRHAYVRPERQREGIAGRLLTHLMALPHQPLLVGTWADAGWAIRFYERHGFRLVGPAEKDRLLRRYWRIPDRQVETSVVLRLEEAGAAGGAPPV